MRKLFLIILLLPIIVNSRVINYNHLIIYKTEKMQLENSSIIDFDNFFDNLLKKWGIDDYIKIKIYFVNRNKFNQINGINKEFVGGFAIPSRDEIYILTPLKFGDFPIDNLNNLMYHEMVHIMLYHYVGGDKLPVWINEGLAQWYGENNPESFRFSLAMLLHKYPKLNQLNTISFYKKPYINYPYSYYFIQYLLDKYDEKKLMLFIKKFYFNNNLENNYESTFNFSLKADLVQFNTTFLSKKFNFFAVFSYSFLFSLGGFLLTIAYIGYLIRRRKILKRMEEEENSDE